jgi:cytochrome oxidase Cu insertion factor (SCO1/SenC/PrrC family)
MKSFVSPVLVAALLLANVVLGQDPLTRDGVRQGFDRKSPAVGDPLPDLKAYNAAGEPIQLGDLQGHYTVLVFGCLT